VFDDADVIFSYSRRQAIADGVLIDVTLTAQEAGIRFPVALTAAAWAKCVAVPPGVACQDEAGRLRGVLTVFRAAARRSECDTLSFAVHVRNDDRGRTPPPVRLKAVCGPGDDAEPVVTIMLPEEGASCHDAG
jgi:hypothetical protein